MESIAAVSEPITVTSPVQGIQPFVRVDLA